MTDAPSPGAPTYRPGVPPPEPPQRREPAGPREFRPRISITIIAAVMIVTTVLLGRWQVNRYYESVSTIDMYQFKHHVDPPVTAITDVDGDRADYYHLRRAELSGVLETDKAQLLTARYVLGRQGYKVLVPLKLDSDGTYDRILVDLGWVPVEELELYLHTLADSRTDVAGRLQRQVIDVVETEPRGEHLGLPTWMRPTPSALAASIDGLDPDLYLVAGEEATGQQVDPGVYPLDGYAPPVRLAPSKHVEYAATWFSVAAVVLGIWVAVSFRRREEPDDDESLAS